MKTEHEYIDEINKCNHRSSLNSILDRASKDGWDMFIVEFGRIIDAKLNRELELFHSEQ